MTVVRLSASSKRAIKSNLNSHHCSGHTELICLFISQHSYHNHPSGAWNSRNLIVALNDIIYFTFSVPLLHCAVLA